MQVSTSTQVSNGIFSYLFSHSSKGTKNYSICFLPSDFFVIENVTAIRLLFSSNDDPSDRGTGFMAGYATYVEGTISSDYYYNIIAAIKQHTHVGRQDSDVLDGAILHNLLTFNDLKTHLIKQFRKITYKIM